MHHVDDIIDDFEDIKIGDRDSDGQNTVALPADIPEDMDFFFEQEEPFGAYQRRLMPPSTILTSMYLFVHTAACSRDYILLEGSRHSDSSQRDCLHHCEAIQHVKGISTGLGPVVRDSLSRYSHLHKTIIPNVRQRMSRRALALSFNVDVAKSGSTCPRVSSTLYWSIDKISNPVKIIYRSEWARRDLSTSKDFMDLCTSTASGTKSDMFLENIETCPAESSRAEFSSFSARILQDSFLERMETFQLKNKPVRSLAPPYTTIRFLEEFFYSIVEAGITSNLTPNRFGYHISSRRQTWRNRRKSTALYLLETVMLYQKSISSLRRKLLTRFWSSAYSVTYAINDKHLFNS